MPYEHTIPVYSYDTEARDTEFAVATTSPTTLETSRGGTARLRASDYEGHRVRVTSSGRFVMRKADWNVGEGLFRF
jgi:hypothetical protein